MNEITLHVIQSHFYNYFKEIFVYSLEKHVITDMRRVTYVLH